jgi:hypothetical protein
LDDVTISSVLDAIDHTTDNSFLVLRMQALSLLLKAVQLSDKKPEVNQPSINVSTMPFSHTHPLAFGAIKRALDFFYDNLPADRKATWARWDAGNERSLPRQGMRRDTAVLHFIIGNAYLQIHSIQSLHSENPVALTVARRLVTVIYIFQNQQMSSGYDVFILTMCVSCDPTDIKMEFRRHDTSSRDEEIATSW